MKSVNQNPDHRARIGYNGFPLSHKLKFSSTIGELLPVFFDLTLPGDKYSLSYELYTRSNPLLKPAWFTLNEKIDWFFVPITQIYQFFGEFFYGIQDLKTSLATPTNFNASSFPHLSTTASDLRDFMSYLQSTQDLYNFDLYGTGCRVAELLGVPVADTNTTSSPAQLFHGISALFPCAYQKIFMDYYRDSDREPVNPNYFSLDRYYQTNTITGYDMSKFFTLRYHRWKPDFFTHVFTSPLWGKDSNQANLSYGFTNNLLNSLSNWLLPQSSRNASFSNDLGNVTLRPDGDQENINPTVLSGRVPTTTWSESASTSYYQITRQVAAATSPQSIRHSFALEKLLEITRRAGKHYDAQTLAHFGVEVPTGIAGEVMFLGSSSAQMQVRDVVATAETPASAGVTEGVALGQQAGKAFTAGHGSKIKFTAPCDGVIMGIYCAIPEVDWQGGLDRLHSYTTRDTWFSEEFDNSGMQPLFQYQVEYNTLANTSNNHIQGYQYPFAERKIKYNRVCGALRRTFRDWTPQKTEMGTAYYDFYVDPHYLDNVFALPYAFDVCDLNGDGISAIITESHVDPDSGQTVIDGYRDLTYDRDPFQHFIEFHCNKSSKMSVFGLPNL